MSLSDPERLIVARLRAMRLNVVALASGLVISLGVVVYLLARDVIGAFTNAWMLYFGLMFVILVLFRPEGIAGMVKSLIERRRPRAERGSALRLIFRNG